MAAGNNVFEVRIVQTIAPNGQVCGERWQIRTKDIIIAVLGISLGTWSPWQDINVLVVQEQS